MLLKKTQKFIYGLSRIMNMAGISLILLMIILIIIDILSRWLFNKPFDGSYELVEFNMVLVVVFALSYTQIKRGHVNVTMLVERFPKVVQLVLNRFANLLGLIMYTLIAWQTIIKGTTEKTVGTTSAVLGIPNYPFVYAAALGFILLCLIFLVQIFFPSEEKC